MTHRMACFQRNNGDHMNEKEIDTEIRHITPAGGNIFADLSF